jgi:hypothetical protein
MAMRNKDKYAGIILMVLSAAIVVFFLLKIFYFQQGEKTYIDHAFIRVGTFLLVPFVIGYLLYKDHKNVSDKGIPGHQSKRHFS